MSNMQGRKNRVDERSEQPEMKPSTTTPDVPSTSTQDVASTSTSDEVMTIDVKADKRKRKPEKRLKV